MKNLLLLPLITAMAGCQVIQQQQHDKAMQQVILFNENHLDRLHAKAMKEHADDFNTFKKRLGQVVKAAYVRERGDCCCTGAELDPISPCPLSKKELTDILELLSQARPDATPQRKDIRPQILASLAWDEEAGWVTRQEPVQPMVIMPPWADLVIDKLQLQNAAGEEVLNISYHDNRKQDGQKLNMVKVTMGNMENSYRCIWVELPGDIYTRFQNSPARLSFKKKVDAADK